ncbi:BolA/IbaG family iron-sulfur metabolism protein [Peredibacter starrii]|uniref:BolA/IbaG family iron-sulfur metabolism protein n=1 Tax=Peredibacter starrii TaxID=28202 RepID=A0AAX4HS88_9BACT|nr:BolA/IbaG family iron-sulfur metabolism protein [Peredibacter starrii]WPU66149.1 BolA/IbaG family iron-sulfur metabolism protein [Peredibacter starrii]
MSTEFQFVEDIIKAGLPDAQVMVEDMTGTRDHLAITVVSDAFKGKLLFEQHQMLMTLLKEELKQRIHAVKLQTYTKEKFALANK